MLIFSTPNLITFNCQKLNHKLSFHLLSNKNVIIKCVMFVLLTKKERKNVSHVVKIIINMPMDVFKLVPMTILNSNNLNLVRNVQ